VCFHRLYFRERHPVRSLRDFNSKVRQDRGERTDVEPTVAATGRWSARVRSPSAIIQLEFVSVKPSGGAAVPRSDAITCRPLPALVFRQLVSASSAAREPERRLGSRSATHVGPYRDQTRAHRHARSRHVIGRRLCGAGFDGGKVAWCTEHMASNVVDTVRLLRDLPEDVQR
jgi:hypothetical protein